MIQLYENIRKRRIELKMSQQELADKLGYKSRSAINKIELGINDIPQSKIIAFAKALDTTPANLMGWKNSSEVDSLQKEQNMSPEQERLICAVKDLTNEQLEEVLTFVDYLKMKQEKDN